MVSPDIRYTQCSGDDSSPCNVAIITCVDKTEPPPICHPDRVKRAEGSAQVACFTLRRLLLQLEWIPPLRLRYGRNDNAFCIGCYKFKCTTYMAAGCRRYIAWYHSPPQVVFETWRAAGLPPLHLMHHVFCILRTQNRHRMRQYTSDSLKNCQLSIVHCQLNHSSSNAPV